MLSDALARMSKGSALSLCKYADFIYFFASGSYAVALERGGCTFASSIPVLTCCQDINYLFICAILTIGS